MPTYRMTLKPVSFHDSFSGLSLTSPDALSLFAHGKKTDIDLIKAELHVSLDSSTPEEDVLCVNDTKEAYFKTHRKRQMLDVVLVPESGLEGRFHFLKAICANGAEDKGMLVEYFDELSHPKEWKEKPFGAHLDGKPQMVRLIFGMRGKTANFHYDIYIRDDTGLIADHPCDPQAGNEPPT